jgi:hypothetical protein
VLVALGIIVFDGEGGIVVDAIGKFTSSGVLVISEDLAALGSAVGVWGGAAILDAVGDGLNSLRADVVENAGIVPVGELIAPCCKFPQPANNIKIIEISTEPSTLDHRFH